MGDQCDVHDEVTHAACLQSGRSADYVIARGSGRGLSLKEAPEFSDVMEESGLLHWWSNRENIAELKFGCTDEAIRIKMVRPPDHIPEEVPVRHI